MEGSLALRLVAADRRGRASSTSFDPAFDTLPAYFDQRLRPALLTLLKAAVAAGQVRGDVDANDLLVRWRACACRPTMTDPVSRSGWSLSSSTGYAMVRSL